MNDVSGVQVVACEYKGILTCNKLAWRYQRNAKPMSALKRKWKHTFQQQRQDHPWWFLVQISVGLWHQLVFSHTWWHPLLPTPKEIVPQLMHDPPFVDVSTISVGKWQMFLPLQVQGQSWESHTTRWRKAFPWDHGSASERILWMEQSAWWPQACSLFSQIGSQSQKSEASFFFCGGKEINQSY